MKVERSNFGHTETGKEIPSSCPKEIRAKIQAAREQRNAPPAVEPEKTDDPERWEMLKKFAAEQVA